MSKDLWRTSTAGPAPVPDYDGRRFRTEGSTAVAVYGVDVPVRHSPHGFSLTRLGSVFRSHVNQGFSEG
jgi:hypothetical protein